MIANPADAVSLERMLGVPTRGIGARTIEVMKEMAAHESITMLEALGRLETARDVALRIAKQAGAILVAARSHPARAGNVGARDSRRDHRAAGFIAYLEGLADGAATRRQNVAELLAGRERIRQPRNPAASPNISKTSRWSAMPTR